MCPKSFVASPNVQAKTANDAAAELGFVMLSEHEIQAIVDDIVTIATRSS